MYDHNGIITGGGVLVQLSLTIAFLIGVYLIVTRRRPVPVVVKSRREVGS